MLHHMRCVAVYYIDRHSNFPYLYCVQKKIWTLKRICEYYSESRSNKNFAKSLIKDLDLLRSIWIPLYDLNKRKKIYRYLVLLNYICRSAANSFQRYIS